MLIESGFTPKINIEMLAEAHITIKGSVPPNCFNNFIQAQITSTNEPSEKMIVYLG